jgi:predicted anti-sigma-YlaC factor YlaD
MADSRNQTPGDCEEMRLLVAWRPTGTLTAQERLLVEAHVPQCPACAELLALAVQLHEAATAGQDIHPEPETLVRFVEDPSTLGPELCARIEHHLAVCSACDEERRLLETVDQQAAQSSPTTEALTPSPIRRSDPRNAVRNRLQRAWDGLAGSLLRPVPAALYLAATIAMALLVLAPRGQHGGSRLEGGTEPMAGPVLLLYDTVGDLRSGDAPTRPVPVLARGRGNFLLLEFTDLGRPLVAGATYQLQIVPAGTEEPLWQTDLEGAALIENYALAVSLAGVQVPAGRYTVSVHDPAGEQIFLAPFESR